MLLHWLDLCWHEALTMKRLTLIGIALLLCIIPASAVWNLTASSIETEGAGWYLTSVGANAIDGDYATKATQGCSGSNTCFVRLKYPTSYPISGCWIYQHEGAYNYHFGSSNATFGNDSWDTNNFDGAGSITFPETLNTDEIDVVLLSQWTTINEITCWAGIDPTPVADFSATPTSGPASLYVSFTDNSPYGTAWNWSITPTTGVIGYIGSVRNHSASFATPGNYTISHGVSNSFGSDIETKTDYITVYNATTAYITTGFAAMDKPRWVQLAGATINLYDVANGSWKNTSSSTTGYEEITTIANGTINAYASLAGYGDVQLLSKPAWNGGTYTLEMLPIGYANVTAGSVTLYVSTWGSDVTNKMPGVTVNLAYLLSGSQYSDYRVTGSAGIAEFVVPNQTTIYIYASKAGYAPGGTTVSSGTGNGGNASVYADITLQRQYVTTAPTSTTLPGGGTPTTAVTVDPRTSEEKQTDMANILLDYGDELVLFFIMLTFIGGIKLIGK